MPDNALRPIDTDPVGLALELAELARAATAAGWTANFAFEAGGKTESITFSATRAKEDKK